MKSPKTILTIALLFTSLAMYAQQAEHVVQRGEDFETISQKYNITVEELKAANPETGVCSVGRKLIIPKHGETIERKAIKATPVELKLKSEEKGDGLNKTSAYQVGNVLWTKHRYDSAKNYLQDAADDGDTRAYYPLADCYSQENGGCHDDAKAVDYYTKTVNAISDKANDEYWMSCQKLAGYYLNGKGTEKNISLARKYYDEYKNSTDKPVTEKDKALNKMIQSAEKNAGKNK